MLLFLQYFWPEKFSLGEQKRNLTDLRVHCSHEQI